MGGWNNKPQLWGLQERAAGAQAKPGSQSQQDSVSQLWEGSGRAAAQPAEQGLSAACLHYYRHSTPC